MEIEARWPKGGNDFRLNFVGFFILASFLALFFLLYFNRLVSSVVCWALRTYTWLQHDVYIDIQAIQISLLGGRIFFVGFRYHGINETILIQNGHITWSYWLRRVRHINLGRRKGSKDVVCSCGGSGGDSGGLGEGGKGIGNDSIQHQAKCPLRLPCRLNMDVAGLEWFVYNRSGAYDSILAGLCGETETEAEAGARAETRANGNEPSGDVPVGYGGPEKQEEHHKLRKRHTPSHADEKLPERPTSSLLAGDLDTKTSEKVDKPDKEIKADLPVFLQLLPIHFTCEKAALVMGNENTTALLTIKAQSLSGEIDAARTQAPDPYRQIFRIRFRQPVIEMRDNDDFREDQVSRALRERQLAQESEPQPPRSFFRHQRRLAYNHLRNLVPYFRKSVESFSTDSQSGSTAGATAAAAAQFPGTGRWQGLSRYLVGPDGDEKTKWDITEYAMLNPILESPEASLTMYWDAVGKVGGGPGVAPATREGPAPGKASPPGLENTSGNKPGSNPPNINGGPPPAWGLALSIHGGSVNYGPWADRKRAELQRVFFPSLCKDAVPAPNLPPGADRVPTQFRLYVELDDEVTLRVPVREASKNWRYKGTDTGTHFRTGPDKKRNRSRFKKSGPPAAAPGQRPYGWLDIKIAANATIAYAMDMVGGPAGFSSGLDLDLPRVEISSSVNQQVLWRSGAQRISCDLSTPLGWNALRQWQFRIASNDLQLFLLRDHVFLLTDLIDDWASGPPSEYVVFTPFRYHIGLSLTNVRIYLNVNDANIINNPTSFDDNAFIVIASPLLDAAVDIPLDRFRPPSNAVSFNLRSPDASVQLHMPPWNTQSTFVRSKDIGRLHDLAVDGKYYYNATIATSNTDTLVLNLTARQPVVSLYGFVLRYFLKLKDNYFGDDVHFKTLEEYQENLRLKASDPKAERADRPPRKLSNDMDVMLNVRIDDLLVLLPANIYSADRHIRLTTPCIDIDLRFTNYYMDLDMVLSPLSVALGEDSPGGLGKLDGAALSPQLFIDGINIYGNRLFGLPPTEPTYLCNWDLSIGAVTGECSAEFLTTLASGGKAFGFTFDDEENALVPYSSVVMFDVTFLRVSLQSVHLWLHVDDAAFLLSLEQGVHVNFNDWARSHYSRRADISIPDFQLSCVNVESAMRHKSRPHTPVETDAVLRTGLSIAIIGRKFDFSNQRRLQQELIRREDQRTLRAQFLLVPGVLSDATPAFVPESVDPPAQPVPPIPYPITMDGLDPDSFTLSSTAGVSMATSRTASIRSRGSKRSLDRKSSFLSLSSLASQESVVHQLSSVSHAPSSASSRLPPSYGGLQPLTPVDPLRTAAVGMPHRRNISSSTRYSGFHSMFGEPASAESGSGATTRDHGHSHHCSRAFSSPYLTPCFPLEQVQPDIREAAMPSVEDEEEDAEEGDSAGRYRGRPPTASTDSGDSRSRSRKQSQSQSKQSLAEFDLEDIDPEALAEDRVYSSVLIRVHQAVSAFLNPTSAKHIANLLSALQPRNPEDILDTVQMGAMDDILCAMRHQDMKGKVSDFAVQIPRANIRFLNSAGFNRDSSGPQHEQDQYDVCVSQVAFMSRTKMTWEDLFVPEETQTQTSFQVRLRSVKFSASERLAGIAGPQVAFTAAIRDVLVSLGSKDITYLDADIGAIEGQVRSEKIEYIAALMHRTGVLVDALTDAFAVPLSYSDRVRPLLAYRLIGAGKGITDPSFLVRPSAVLRSVHRHLRTFDSWKLAMHFRQIWSLMKPRAREELVSECLQYLEPNNGPEPASYLGPASPIVSAPSPERITQTVLASLDRWRGWDLDDIRSALFLLRLLGDLKKVTASASRSTAATATTTETAQTTVTASSKRPMPFMAVVQVNRLRMVLDPDLNQNEVSYADLTVRFENSVQGVVPSAQSMAVLNIYCGDAAVRLNWELCELADDILRTYKKRLERKAAAAKHGRASGGGSKAVQKSLSKDGKSKAATAYAAVANSPLESIFHVVVAVDHGSILVDAVNLNVRWVGDDMKSSLLLHSRQGATTDTNFILGCRSISSRVKSHSELLMTYKLDGPSIFASYAVQYANARPAHTIKATASSRNYSLDVKQDPLYLLEIVDLLVKDEAAQLFRLKEQFPIEAPVDDTGGGKTIALAAKDESGSITSRLSAYRFNIALFLDSYTMTIPLLRSLTYTVSGVVARVAVAANFGREIILDFDVKDNAHDMKISVNNVPNSISLLQIPPNNGRVTLEIGEREQSVTVFSSLELVQLDASAVYSLLSALNRPEISNTITEIQHQVKLIKRNLAEILDSDASAAPPSVPAAPATTADSAPKRALVYSVHSTFAGLEIFGNSPLKTDPAPLAHLSFCLDSIKLEVTNRLENGGPVLVYPEVHIHLRQIAFDILKGPNGHMTSCGSLTFAALIRASSKPAEGGKDQQSLEIKSDAFDVSLSPDTVSTAVEILGYMGNKIKGLDTSRELEYLRKLRQSKPRITINDLEPSEDEEARESDIIDSFFSSMAYTFELRNIQVNWLCASTATPTPPLKRFTSQVREDFVFLLERMEFSTRTTGSARLTLENLQMQMVPPTQDKKLRSANSALLPQLIFKLAYFSSPKSRRLAFQAVGKSLDLRLTSQFIFPASHLKDSIQLSIKNVQEVSRSWTLAAASTASPLSLASASSSSSSPLATAPSAIKAGADKKPKLGSKRLESFLVDLDFGGAVVHINGTKSGPTTGGTSTNTTGAGTTTSAYGSAATGSGSGATAGGRSQYRRPAAGGKYGQFNTDDPGSSTVLRSPGLAWKLRYRDTGDIGRGDPSLYAEVKINASSNVLYPSVVPIVMDITDSIQEMVSQSRKSAKQVPLARAEDSEEMAKAKTEESGLLSAAGSRAILDRLNLNLGLHICKQQFSLSCQPIARVAATTSFEDVYLTVNTVRSEELGPFVAMSGNLRRLQASVQHVYSRESTGSFEVDSIELSCMNSRHVSGVNGLSALLKFSPMKVAINARQLQDFLLFREIWMPREIRKGNTVSVSQEEAAAAATAAATLTPTSSTTTQQVHLVQRYQQVAATAAFPWTATIAMAELEISVDLGQTIGKSVFAIEDFWVSSKKTSGWEQNLCLGFRRVGVQSSGRMSGFVALEDFKLRTVIQWPAREQALSKTPLVQASISFRQLRIKASFDYQAFLVADVRSLGFLMYNVRRGDESGSSGSSSGGSGSGGDRLVAFFDGEAVQVFGTTTTAAQSVALYQAFLRLVQERRTNFETALREIEKFISRRPSTSQGSGGGRSDRRDRRDSKGSRAGSDMGSSSRSSSSGLKGKSPISLDTEVVVTLKVLNLGVFPGTFTDNQVFKMEALNAQARFAANFERGRIHSNLGLTLGQLRIGLANVRHVQQSVPAVAASARAEPGTAEGAAATAASGEAAEGGGAAATAAAAPAATTTAASAKATTSTTAAVGSSKTPASTGVGPAGPSGAVARTTTVPKSANDLSVEDVVLSATGSRGGTILKVPQVEASMQTWQQPDSRKIDYIFKSAFEGKVEVGWNYSRISYIRDMMSNHSRALEQTWGRELPLRRAIRVTGVPEEKQGKQDKSDKSDKSDKPDKPDKQQKITAEVTMPLSKYEYRALEPAVIETPQLRDMGEATPPLEWIGLHRDRLPNLTHQIVIVALLELAGEVEDAYSRILGST